jgi:hypothetical protein
VAKWKERIDGMDRCRSRDVDLRLMFSQLTILSDQTNEKGRSHRKVRYPLRCFPEEDVSGLGLHGVRTNAHDLLALRRWKSPSTLDTPAHRAER